MPSRVSGPQREASRQPARGCRSCGQSPAHAHGRRRHRDSPARRRPPQPGPEPPQGFPVGRGPLQGVIQEVAPQQDDVRGLAVDGVHASPQEGQARLRADVQIRGKDDAQPFRARSCGKRQLQVPYPQAVRFRNAIGIECGAGDQQRCQLTPRRRGEGSSPLGEAPGVPVAGSARTDPCRGTAGRQAKASGCQTAPARANSFCAMLPSGSRPWM